jgi:hypothetical protein
MYNSTYFAKLRASRKEKGLCLACGQHPFPCAPCRTKNRERMRKIRAGIPIEEKKASWKTKRDYFLKKKFGIDTRDYGLILKLQNGRCAICNSTEIGNKRTKHFAIDHCHKTNQIRGLLCSPCNKGLGMFQDSVENLKTAIDYLTKYN